MCWFQESQRITTRDHNSREDQRTDFHTSTPQNWWDIYEIERCQGFFHNRSQKRIPPHHLGKSSRAKTAFVTPFGKYKFLMVPFGLAQAPAYFHLLMNKVLNGLKFAMMYLDDIIIFSENELQHLEHLETVFSHLREAGLKMKWSKCDFFKREIHYLGHLISPEGISPLPNKLDCIQHMPAPKNVKEIKQFLGLTGYYRKFVPRFANISRPLTTLTKKDKKFKWTPACRKSFDLLKKTLCGEPILKYADTSKPYTLYTDASKFGWAGVLTQSHTTVILLITQLHLSVVCSEVANSTWLPWWRKLLPFICLLRNFHFAWQMQKFC